MGQYNRTEVLVKSEGVCSGWAGDTVQRNP